MAARKKAKTEAAKPEEETKAKAGAKAETEAKAEAKSERKAEAGAEKETGKAEAEEFVFPNPCVYCGPTIKNVARQYTTYQGGIPKALKDFVKAHPMAKELIVSTGKFAATRRKLETPGSAEAIIYRKLKEV